MDLASISRKEQLSYQKGGESIGYMFDLPIEDSVRIEKQMYEGKTTWKLWISNEKEYYHAKLCASTTLDGLIKQIKEKAARNSGNWSWWNKLFHPYQPVFRELAMLLKTSTWIE
jgi:hypothetical protein